MNQIVDIASLVLVIAGITVLVRPGSQGPSLVSNVFSGFSSLVGAATNFG